MAKSEYYNWGRRIIRLQSEVSIRNYYGRSYFLSSPDWCNLLVQLFSWLLIYFPAMLCVWPWSILKKSLWVRLRPWLRNERYQVQVLLGSGRYFPAVLRPTVNWELVAWHEKYVDVANGIEAFGLWLVDLTYPPPPFRSRIWRLSMGWWRPRKQKGGSWPGSCTTLCSWPARYASPVNIC